MWEWFVGGWRAAGLVAASTALIYVWTILGIRCSERRTLADMSSFDLVVAVAMGAVVGRTATQASPSFVQGATAILALIAMHHLLGRLRLTVPTLRRLLDRRPQVVAVDGSPLDEALRRSHLTEDDLLAALRERGVRRLDQAAVVVLESTGRCSVLLKDDKPIDPHLLHGVERPHRSDGGGAGS